MDEVIAFSYAALQPTNALLNKYLSEIDKLEAQGKINERDHQLLRSSAVAQRELMDLTLGEEDALTNQTVTETLKRVENEIRQEEREKYESENAAHRQTQEVLDSERSRMQLVQSNLYWRCRRKANLYAWFVSSVLIISLLCGG